MLIFKQSYSPSFPPQYLKDIGEMHHQNQSALISTAHWYFCRGAVELVILSVLCHASTAERMEKVSALTIPWGWHNKCMSTVIVTKLLVIKHAVWKDLLLFFPHKAYLTCGKGMLLSMGQFCSIIWQHEFAYQFFLLFPHEYTYIILKAIYNMSKCLRRILKI